MIHSLRDLLSGLIDYAGLFPPAALDMTTAVRKYAEYRESEFRWALGRFVVPVARLDEFEKAAKEIPFNRGRDGNDPWLLSAISGVDFSSDLNRIVDFNRKYAPKDSSAGIGAIDTIEIKIDQPAAIDNAMKLISAKITPYFEIPIGDDPTQLIENIAEIEARAKVRTGGVKDDAFPTSHNLARFIKICAERDVPFKATAGLHHPLRSVNKLTYAPDSASTMMHGFLNVFVAAAFAQNGMDVDLLVEALEEKSPEAFQFDTGGVTWRDEMIVRGQLRNTRSLLAIAFGSCSFEEPIEDLKKMNLL